jgi:hypothetical protein
MLFSILVLGAAGAAPTTCPAEQGEASALPSHLYQEEDVAKDSVSISGQGIELANAGDLAGSLKMFRAASARQPWSSDIWHNLGIALRTMAMGDVSDTTALPLLRESVASFEMARRLMHVDKDGAMQWTQGQLQLRADASASRRGKRLSAAERRKLIVDRALNMQRAGDHIAAVNHVCKGPGSVAVTLSDAERCAGAPNAFTAGVVWGLMRVCGVVVVRDAVPLPDIDAAFNLQAGHFAAFAERTLGPNSTARRNADGELEETSEYGQRSAKRYEVRLALDEHAFSAIALNRWVLAVTRLVLGEAIEIDTFSRSVVAPRRVRHSGRRRFRCPLTRAPRLPPLRSTARGAASA